MSSVSRSRSQRFLLSSRSNLNTGAVVRHTHTWKGLQLPNRIGLWSVAIYLRGSVRSFKSVLEMCLEKNYASSFLMSYLGCIHTLVDTSHGVTGKSNSNIFAFREDIIKISSYEGHVHPQNAAIDSISWQWVCSDMMNLSRFVGWNRQRFIYIYSLFVTIANDILRPFFLFERSHGDNQTTT